MKQIFQDLVEKGSSKTFGSRVRHNASLSTYIQNFRDMHGARSINEAIYCIVNGIKPPKCPCGNIKSFDSFDKGYGTFCSLKCPDKGKVHSTKMKEVWKEPGKIEAMIATRDQTMINTYGVKSAMQFEPFKQKWMESNGINTKPDTNQTGEC